METQSQSSKTTESSALAKLKSQLDHTKDLLSQKEKAVKEMDSVLLVNEKDLKEKTKTIHDLVNAQSIMSENLSILSGFIKQACKELNAECSLSLEKDLCHTQLYDAEAAKTLSAMRISSRNI